MPSEEEIAAAKTAEDKAAADKAAAGEKAKDGGQQYTMEQVVAGMQHLHNTNQNLVAEMKAMKDEAAKKHAAPTPGGKKEENLETLTREEFMGCILQEAEKRLVVPIKEAQAKDAEQRSTVEARKQIEGAAEKYPDFWEFQEEMKSVIKEFPDMDIEEAYVLARSRNTDKAGLIDKKAAEEADKKAEKEKKEAEPKYGGLLPTSGSTKRTQHMKAGDAAEAAWTELGIGEHISAINSN